MKKRAKILISLVLGLATFVSFIAYQGVEAASNSTINQTINPGTLTTDIRSDATTSVGSPSVAMSAKTFSFNCQSAGSASTGTFGTATERIYVDNPNAANNGWTLSIAATGGGAALWHNAASTTKFDFNDAAGSGCTDGDADTFKGQLTINPSAETITADYSGSDVTNLTKGTQASFTAATAINLLTAAAGAADIWRGYVTGITLSQTIPAETPADSYSLGLTLTIVAS